MPKKIEVRPGDAPDQAALDTDEIVRQWGASIGVSATFDGACVRVKAQHGESVHKIEPSENPDDLLAALDLIRTNELMV